VKARVPCHAGQLARNRLLSLRGEPLFYADWDNALFIHFETDPRILQRSVPYELDLYDGQAFVSLVAFRMRGMRPRMGGRLGALLLKPIATHNFLNLRTYVRYRGEPAIFFMREWLDNELSVWLGPSTFGLPYRFGKIDYRGAGLRGDIRAPDGALKYQAELSHDAFATCEPGSLAEFLLERYTAFTQSRLTKRFFRIWHEPWRQVPARVALGPSDLIASSGQWWRKAQCTSANYSPGVEVWMGWPHQIDRLHQ